MILSHPEQYFERQPSDTDGPGKVCQIFFCQSTTNLQDNKVARIYRQPQPPPGIPTQGCIGVQQKCDKTLLYQSGTNPQATKMAGPHRKYNPAATGLRRTNPPLRDFDGNPGQRHTASQPPSHLRFAGESEQSDILLQAK